MTEGSARISKPAIIGIAFGVVMLVAIIAWGVYYFTRGPSEEDVAAFVKTDMQGYFDSDPQMAKYHFPITVRRVDLIHTSGTEYKGIATVRAKGADHNVAITVNYDGEKGMWQADRGAFLFLLTG